jgi:hypothetical protein
MNTLQMVNDVAAFFDKMNFPFPEVETPLNAEVTSFRISCLREELNELNTAKNVEDFIDAVIDLSYFAVGTALLLGQRKHIALEVRQLESSALLRAQMFTDMLQKNFTHDFDIGIITFADYAQHEPHLAAQGLYEIISYCNLIMRSFHFSFDKHWAEVHYWNMRKEPASDKKPSKRGYNALDAVKPVGWLGPDHLKVLVGTPHHALV